MSKDEEIVELKRIIAELQAEIAVLRARARSGYNV